MATDSDTNSYVKDGKLYITPTLTEDAIGRDNVLNGHTFNLTSCTNMISGKSRLALRPSRVLVLTPVTDGKGGQILNPDACGAVSNSTTGTIIPPVMSARLHTKGHASIQSVKKSLLHAGTRLLTFRYKGTARSLYAQSSRKGEYSFWS